MALCERAGPGCSQAGDISAIFSVLVQGSDMEGPIADIMRGTLDGHVVLSREIAERGRFPAIDITKSVSRSLPEAASESERQILSEARRTISVYEDAQVLIRSGLYESGTDSAIDDAIIARPKIESFLADRNRLSVEKSFQLLAQCILEKNS